MRKFSVKICENFAKKKWCKFGEKNGNFHQTFITEKEEKLLIIQHSSAELSEQRIPEVFFAPSTHYGFRGIIFRETSLRFCIFSLSSFSRHFAKKFTNDERTFSHFFANVFIRWCPSKYELKIDKSLNKCNIILFLWFAENGDFLGFILNYSLFMRCGWKQNNYQLFCIFSLN